jgi:selT/selW/selH-like putative selenoprotein
MICIGHINKKPVRDKHISHNTYQSTQVPPSLPQHKKLNIMADTTESAPVHLPRVAITFCTQCRWMLRAAYFAQELLSTFGGSLGEVALIPATGGLFTVHLTYKPVGEEGEGSDVQTREVLLWDRKAEGGFPETKILKQRVRNHIEPNKDLGHSDGPAKKVKSNGEGVKEGEISAGTAKEEVAAKTDDSTTADCADCK